MRRVLRLTGMSVFWISGIVTWLFYVGALREWLGMIGILVGIFVAPGAIIFPFIYWLAEHEFPVRYFVLWATGLAGIGLAALAAPRTPEA